VLQLERKEIYKQIQPAALTDKDGLEATAHSYDDVLRCLNLLANHGISPDADIERDYQEACILYMYDIIDTLAARLSYADSERFKS